MLLFSLSLFFFRVGRVRADSREEGKRGRFVLGIGMEMLQHSDRLDDRFRIGEAHSRTRTSLSLSYSFSTTSTEIDGMLRRPHG
jgi:hypothetical protein